jgi:hypothetical protein
MKYLLINKNIMGRIIRLTEQDLGRIVRRVISEMDDDDDSDYENKSLKELIKIAEDFLLNELGFSPDAIDEIDEWYIIDVLRDHHYDELASEIEEKLYDSYDSYDSDF